MVEPGSPRPRAASPAAGVRREGIRARRVGRLAAVAVVTVVVAAIAAACGSGPDGEDTSAGTPASSLAGVSTSTPGTAAILAEPAAPDPDPASTGVATTDATGVGSADPPPMERDVEVEGGAPLPIGTLELALVDPSRPTVSRGTTISSTRSLPTVVAYPTGSGGPWPLVVFAHGFRLGPKGYSRLVATLVAEGYVVAAPSFPLADEERVGASVDRGDLPNQPGDLSFVIDQVLGAASDPSSPLAGRVDGSRIGAVGHSDGADTVLDLGYTAGRADPRVRAIVALSPDAVVAAGTGVGAGTPLLLEHGDADDVVPYAESRSVFANVPARRYFLTLLGAGHLRPVTEASAWTPILDATIVSFLDRYVAGRTTDDSAISGPPGASAVARIELAG
jgi:dienelactone hydrolase